MSHTDDHGFPGTDDDADLLGLLLARRERLVEARKRAINPLHALLTDMLEGDAKSDLTPSAASKLLARCRPTSDVDTLRKQLAHELLTDWRRRDRQLNAATSDLTEAVAATGTTITSIPGVATIGAAMILSIVGDVRRFPTGGHFAAFTGTAAIEAFSGDVTRQRLSRRGDRQLNRTLHIAARTQTRRGGVGRPYYHRKIAEGKIEREALRCLKRQLSSVVYRRLHADQRARGEAVRGGHHGTNMKVA